MGLDMEVPRYQELHGTGTFSKAGENFTSEFLLLRNPHWMGVLTRVEEKKTALRLSMSIHDGSSWQLRGTLQGGRPILSDSLVNTGYAESPYNLGFSIFETLFLGKSLDEPPLWSEFPLINYFEGAISVIHGDWQLDIFPDPSRLHTQYLTRQWNLPAEGMTLRCVRPDSTRDDHLDMARSVMILASLALGMGVSNHRHVLGWKSATLETWRFMIGDELGPGPVVPARNMSSFLSVALPAFESLTPDKKELIRLTISYINLSEIGYLDTRILGIVQAWEFLSAAWVPRLPLPDDLLCLRSRLTRLLKDWRQDHKRSDPDGFWGNRVLSALDWARLNQQLQEFAAVWGVDLEVLGIDLSLLRRFRDSVAHEGSLPRMPSGDSKTRYDLLRNARHALRLILLQILGYRGPVLANKGGWKTSVAMDDALRGKYGAV